jgi:hypothetical protein
MPGKTARADLYNTLKEQGWEPDKPFAKYSTAELQEISSLYISPEPAPAPPTAPPPQAPARDEEVLRTDEQGRQWLQEEVRKPAYPKPRGRRVLTYVDPGVEQQTVRNGEYIETVEVAGNRTNRTSEIKITLPSFQVGIYRDRRYPFRIHTYNGREGFDLRDVEQFYGGAELVPNECKRVYIENDLCYDIRSVVAAIRTEFRQQQLQREIR